MLVLGIDTSTRRVGVVLVSEAGLLARVELGGAVAASNADVTARVPTPRHAETLAPAIEYVCRAASIRVDHLSAIAVGIGPGMFTGLRVGVTTAKVLAHALRIPVIPVPSLDLLAYPLRHSRAVIVPAIDARRREVYYALYRAVPGGVQRSSDYEIGSAEDLASELTARGEDALLCGDGIARFRSVFAELDRVEFAGIAHAAPSLSALAELAVARYEREDFTAPADLVPMYLRRSDAEISWEARSA
jgi:tRNA threonylcarbamoyladenosine biosynthesis protein TsaB